MLTLPTIQRCIGIRMCYELLDGINTMVGAMNGTPQEKDGYFIGAVQFALLHETGHSVSRSLGARRPRQP